MRRRTPAPAPLTTINLFDGSLTQLQQKLRNTKATYLSSYLNRDWVGDNFNSISHATQRLESGDAMLFEKYRMMEKTIKPKPFDYRTTYTPDVEGLFFDIGLYVQGVPECWLREEPEEITPTRGDIYINIGLNNQTKQDDVFKKLANIVQLIDTLESTGQRLNIFLVSNGTPLRNTHTHSKTSFTLKVKDEKDPLNLQQLVYLIATPVLLRFVVLFLRSELFTAEGAGQFTGDDNAESEMMAKKDIIYIPSMHYDYEYSISNYTDIKAIYPHLKDKI